MRFQQVEVDDGVSLNVHGWDGEGVPFLLVHGLASNLHLWDGVAEGMARRGHAVAAVDLRGHGRSDKPAGGYDFATVTDDLATLIGALGFERSVVAGQSWGANLVLELAWRHPELVRGVACIDGGWIELDRRFPDWDDCARTLTPPATTGRAASEIESWVRGAHPDWPEAGITGALACFEHLPDGTVRPWLSLEHHLAILRSLWEHRPSTRYPGVKVPVLLVPADPRPASGDPAGADDRRREVEAAVASLPRSRVRWVPGDHDLHAQHPEQVAALLHQCSDEGFFT